MKNSYRFFKNSDCEFFPCHRMEGEEFNCLFCYCPFYYLQCPGTPAYVNCNGTEIKDCSGCDFPHRPENYEIIIDLIRHLNCNGRNI